MSDSRRRPLTCRHSDETIAFNAGKPVSVGQFITDACQLAHKLPDYRYVINLQVDRYAYLLTFHAAIIAGQCTLMPPNRQKVTVAGIRAAYPDSYMLEELPTPTTDVSARIASNRDCPSIPADRLCAIAFTSGSTGTPKPNLKYWDTLVGGGNSNRRLLFSQAGETVNLVATVPPQHMWGLEMSIMLPLFANVAVCNRTPFFPQDFVDVLASVPEPRMLVTAPIHLEALFRSGLTIPRLSRIFTATAPLSKQLAAAVENRFDTEVTEVFGCSETGILAARKTSSESLWAVADAFNLQTDENGASVVASHLREHVELPDVIELTGKQQFRWLGRQQDMINIAGKRGSLAEINLKLREVPGVSDGVIFMPRNGGKRLAALAIAPGVRESDILNHLKHQIEPAFLPRPLYCVDSLPRQATGKLPAKALQECFERVRRSRS